MKPNNKLKNLLLITILFMGIISCDNYAEEEDFVEEEIEETEDPGTGEPETAVSFATDIKPIVDNNCIGCHSGGVGGQFPNLTTYTSIKNNSQSFLQEITSKRMPQGGSLTTQEIELVKSWVDSGALNN